MDHSTEVSLRTQLLDRRHRIQDVLSQVAQAADMVRLLQEVDSALKRIDTHTFGGCQVCKETVDDDFLLANPMIQYCLCTLGPAQQEALQKDLELASRIQWALLPKQNLRFAGFEVHFRYLPAGPVSGDFCDLVTKGGEDEALYFLLGDVSGKGVAASFLMARLNALFRSLIDLGHPVHELVERANRLFSEGAIGSHYATVVCGKASPSGEVEICNAGHCPPLVVRGLDVASVESTGLPVGMFGGSPYAAHRVSLVPGETLVLYSDGLTEANDGSGQEYGARRLSELLRQGRELPPVALAAACLEDLSRFTAGADRQDDLTVMVVRRTG